MVAEVFVRLYEGLSALLAIGGLIYVIRKRNPFYAGLYLGSAVGGGVFEWIFDTKWYFNLTTDPRLILLWSIDGVPAALAMIFFYTFFFGIPLILLVEHARALMDRFNTAIVYGAVVVLAMVGVQLFEGFNTSVVRIYTYHQADRFLSWGMPWSNLWFSPLIFGLALWGALRMRDVLHSVARLNQQAIVGAAHKGGTAVALGFAVLVTAYFVAFALNGIWYLLAQPWVSSGRPF